MAFWKSPKRKVYAVVQNTDSSDNELDEPRHKKIKQQVVDGMISYTIVENLSGVAANIEQMKEHIEEIRMCAADSKLQIPIALKTSLSENFKCRICHSMPIKPPLMLARCCKSTLSCDTCCRNWYSGPEAIMKRCPLCRAERGLSRLDNNIYTHLKFTNAILLVCYEVTFFSHRVVNSWNSLPQHIIEAHSLNDLSQSWICIGLIIRMFFYHDLVYRLF